MESSSLKICKTSSLVLDHPACENHSDVTDPLTKLERKDVSKINVQSFPVQKRRVLTMEGRSLIILQDMSSCRMIAVRLLR